VRHIFPCGNENAIRLGWRKNTVGRELTRQDGHAAANQVPLCWTLDLNWTPLCDT